MIERNPCYHAFGSRVYGSNRVYEIWGMTAMDDTVPQWTTALPPKIVMATEKGIETSSPVAARHATLRVIEYFNVIKYFKCHSRSLKVIRNDTVE